ncbi:MAG: electron transfer flavoprotein subunit alpha/FixB family protein [Bacteroidota bacterium]|nr:electron transfer flavoprotein subunit alpha/FixB family protein [Bacteroidota bacterium]MDX5430956.1 electron transfer flavoprotein subunit alpha/FixB family protein [Bacteroidota bacterium]MDX5469707.1 electron transfer flavoprotein subunit alpha/FixB family protein [Bacteroidota bacterium]
MNVLVFAESSEGNFKKSVFEAVSYAKLVASATGGEVIAHCASAQMPGDDVLASLGTYGAQKVLKTALQEDRPAAMAEALASAAKANNAGVVVITNNYNGKSMAPSVAVALDASLTTGVISVPDTSNGFVVKRSVFSGKGFGFVSLNGNTKVLAITPNTFAINASGSAASVSEFSADLGAGAYQVKSTSVDKVQGKIPLTEAELVVSGGRGMKGPENWGMIEELAGLLGAATACSKPVSDMDWRPHEEHVGQTGITIKPNLYIAVGISGAIQHLAGVSSSKVIVAINKDPEAPFFKVADYGIVGDAFEVLPQIIEATKQLKSAQ